MKKEIHPEYYKDAKVTCSCGNVFTIGSTVKEMNVEVCSACHPFYTGTEKVMDSAGRVEKFKARAKAAEKDSKENKKTKKTETKQTEEAKTEKNNEEA